MSNKKQNYISNYNKKKYKMYQFRVKKSDAYLIAKLDSVPNRNEYIMNLIRKDVGTPVLSVEEIKERIKPVMDKHNIKDVYLFGSYARGEATNKSDVDIYCDNGDVDSLIDEGEFIVELEEALGKEVDIVTFGSRMPDSFRKQLEKDKIKIL